MAAKKVTLIFKFVWKYFWQQWSTTSWHWGLLSVLLKYTPWILWLKKIWKKFHHFVASFWNQNKTKLKLFFSWLCWNVHIPCVYIFFSFSNFCFQIFFCKIFLPIFFFKIIFCQNFCLQIFIIEISFFSKYFLSDFFFQIFKIKIRFFAKFF